MQRDERKKCRCVRGISIAFAMGAILEQSIRFIGKLWIIIKLWILSM